MEEYPPAIFIDGDFKTGKQCKYHCSPTCHPAQVGPDWKYGCLHKAWRQNRYGDFCPIVNCDGNLEKCEIPIKSLNLYIGGKKRSITALKNKLHKVEQELNELGQFKKEVI